MRRNPFSRMLGALALVWFAVVTVEPDALHSCPVHGAPVAGAVAEHGGSHGDHMAAGHASGDHGTGHDAEPHRCACVGDCAASAAISAPPDSWAIVVPAAIRQSRLVAPHGDIPSVVAPAFLRPYPNGPPADPRIA